MNAKILKLVLEPGRPAVRIIPSGIGHGFPRGEDHSKYGDLLLHADLNPGERVLVATCESVRAAQRRRRFLEVKFSQGPYPRARWRRFSRSGLDVFAVSEATAPRPTGVYE